MIDCSSSRNSVFFFVRIPLMWLTNESGCLPCFYFAANSHAYHILCYNVIIISLINFIYCGMFCWAIFVYDWLSRSRSLSLPPSVPFSCIIFFYRSNNWSGSMSVAYLTNGNIKHCLINNINSHNFKRHPLPYKCAMNIKHDQFSFYYKNTCIP